MKTDEHMRSDTQDKDYEQTIETEDHHTEYTEFFEYSLASLSHLCTTHRVVDHRWNREYREPSMVLQSRAVRD